MKNFLGYVLSVLLMGGIFLSCSDQEAPTANDKALTPFNKVTVVEYTFDYDLDLDPPTTDCLTGVPMQAHGIILFYVKEITTPSGNWIASGYADYNAYGDITFENTVTGEVWTLKNGKNPWNEISKHNGAYRLHFHWNELYKLNNQNLNVHSQGYFTVDKDGNVTKDIFTYRCN
jgi:hypothetical protein